MPAIALPRFERLRLPCNRSHDGKQRHIVVARLREDVAGVGPKLDLVGDKACFLTEFPTGAVLDQLAKLQLAARQRPRPSTMRSAPATKQNQTVAQDENADTN